MVKVHFYHERHYPDQIACASVYGSLSGMCFAALVSARPPWRGFQAEYGQGGAEARSIKLGSVPIMFCEMC